MRVSFGKVVMLCTICFCAVQAYSSDVTVSAENWNEHGWMEGGWGKYIVVFSNKTDNPVHVIKRASGWDGHGHTGTEKMDLTIKPKGRLEHSILGHLSNGAVKHFNNRSPVMKGTFTIVTAGETGSIPYSVTIPVARLSEPMVTLSGKFVGVRLQKSHLTNFPGKDTMIRWMNQAYMQMEDLTGGRPYNKNFLVIKESPPHPWWAYAGNPIILNCKYVNSTLKDFNEGLPSFGWIHEMGHDFDDGIGQWYNFNGPFVEFQANIKLVYALLHMADRDKVRMKHGGNTYRTPDKNKKLDIDHWLSVFARYYGDRYLASTNSWEKMSSDDFLSFFMRIADVYGWEPIKQWFRTYRAFEENDFTPPREKKDKINLMCAILSETTGTNMVPAFQLWRLPVSDESVANIKERYSGQSRSPAVQAWRIAPDRPAWTNTAAFVPCPPETREAIMARAKAAPLVISSRMVIDLRKLLPGDRNDNCAAYAMRTIQCKQPRNVKFLTGSDDALRIWVNGKLVQEILKCHEAKPDSENVTVTLKAGKNDILVESSQASGYWGYCFRITDEDDNPLELAENGTLAAPAVVQTIFDK
jgi:hypothetical protein